MRISDWSSDVCSSDLSGLMGPYMRPIPINASAGMLLSLMIALIVTPWLSLKLLKRHDDDGADQAPATDPSGEGAVAQGNMGPGDTNEIGRAHVLNSSHQCATRMPSSA